MKTTSESGKLPLMTYCHQIIFSSLQKHDERQLLIQWKALVRMTYLWATTYRLGICEKVVFHFILIDLYTISIKKHKKIVKYYHHDFLTLIDSGEFICNLFLKQTEHLDHAPSL